MKFFPEKPLFFMSFAFFFISSSLVAFTFEELKIKEAELYFKRRNFAESKRILETILAKNPDFQGAKDLLNQIQDKKKDLFYEFTSQYKKYLGMGDLDNALRVSVQFLEIFPGDANVEKFKLEIEGKRTEKRKLKNEGISITVFDSSGAVLQRPPSQDEVNAEKIFSKGKIFFNLGQFSKAVGEFELAVKLVPYNPGYKTFLEQAIKKRDVQDLVDEILKFRLSYKKEVVLEKINVLLSQDPDLHLFRWDRGKILFLFHEYQKALQDLDLVQFHEQNLEKSAKTPREIRDLEYLKGNYPQRTFLRAKCLKFLNRFEESWALLINLPKTVAKKVGYFSIFLELFSIYGSLYFLPTFLIAGFFLGGLFALSIPLYEFGVLFKESKPGILKKLFLAYWNLSKKNYPAAEVILDNLVKEGNGSNLEMVYLHGLVLAKLGKTTQAEALFQRCAALNKHFSRAYLFSGLFFGSPTGKQFVEIMKKTYLSKLKEPPTLYYWIYPNTLEEELILARSSKIEGNFEKALFDLGMASIGIGNIRQSEK